MFLLNKHNKLKVIFKTKDLSKGDIPGKDYLNN